MALTGEGCGGVFLIHLPARERWGRVMAADRPGDRVSPKHGSLQATGKRLRELWFSELLEGDC